MSNATRQKDRRRRRHRRLRCYTIEGGEPLIELLTDLTGLLKEEEGRDKAAVERALETFLGQARAKIFSARVTAMAKGRAYQWPERGGFDQ